MSEGEKTRFNGNLALLRVCAIVLIVNVFSIIIKMLFIAGHGGLLVSLWNALTTSSFDDFLGMGGLLIASGLAGPIVLGVLAIAFALGAGIFALVKNNVAALKVVAVVMLIWAFAGPITLGLGGEFRNMPGVIASLIFNENLVVAIAAFFIAPKKRVEENNEAVVQEGFNLDLHRFCAACFLVDGLAGTAGAMFGFAFSLPLVFIYFAVAVASIVALAKKNADILVACSFAMVAQIIWSIFQIMGMGEWNVFAKSATIVHCFLNTTVVVCVAAFFIEPERTRNYFNKVKSLFAKQK